jgi:predicted anti-sigma-YlaC factor YlaD
MLLEATHVDAHVQTCTTCHAWLDGAERVTRVARLRLVDVPDLTARILALLQADGTVHGSGRVRPSAARRRSGSPSGDASIGRSVAGHPGWAARLQWILGALAILQLLVALPTMLGAAGHDAHTAREVAALEIALSVGLLVTAFYPEYAAVFAPVAITLVVCFAAISALDAMEGAVTVSQVAVHLLTLAQAAVVWRVARDVSQSAAAQRSAL